MENDFKDEMMSKSLKACQTSIHSKITSALTTSVTFDRVETVIMGYQLCSVVFKFLQKTKTGENFKKYNNFAILNSLLTFAVL